MRADRVRLFLITAILVAIGIIMIYTSSAIYAFERYKDSAYFVKRHLLFCVIGSLAMIGTLSVPYRMLRRIAKPALFLALLFLGLVLFPPFGSSGGGANRWFQVGGFRFQPSEPAKIALFLYLADLLSRKKNDLHLFKEGYLPPVLVLGLLTGLVLLQPDLGTAMAIVLVALSMFLVAGTRPRFLVMTLLSAVPAFLILIVMEPYRIRRILAFFDPERDPQGVGFQIMQSYVALGSGGLFGVGLGQSNQKLFYLPASHTDFIFSIIGEELGLLGTLAVLSLFFLFSWTCYRLLVRVQDRFGRLLGFGIAAMLTLEALVNIGVACGALPTKGLPLPFISYGGSALIFNLVGVGLLLNISRYGRESSSVFSSSFLEAGKAFFIPKNFQFRPRGRRK